ncbi:hypothetical protein ACJBUE_13555 [Ralstonia syzygii subsp. celebesensis]|uniref:hypothetical protein n=1 Tax=Ralstonia syzygii TaxID=28097 RepID=UPI001560C819|nr:hypothetical protein [Ralstonia syzygii]QQV54859.1 hypothetical protein JK151_12075 [Ralstonia syzygii subsp. celebesensis]
MQTMQLNALIKPPVAESAGPTTLYRTIGHARCCLMIIEKTIRIVLPVMKEGARKAAGKTRRTRKIWRLMVPL